MGFLDIDNVTKSYGAVEVLHKVDIEVHEGEFLVLVGPSGCGKSTLLNMIAGLEGISSGEIRIKDRVMNGVHPSRRNIAMVFQSYALYPNMTVGQNITFGLEMHGTPKAERLKLQEKIVFPNLRMAEDQIAISNIGIFNYELKFCDTIFQSQIRRNSTKFVPILEKTRFFEKTKKYMKLSTLPTDQNKVCQNPSRNHRKKCCDTIFSNSNKLEKTRPNSFEKQFFSKNFGTLVDI